MEIGESRYDDTRRSSSVQLRLRRNMEVNKIVKSSLHVLESESFVSVKLECEILMVKFRYKLKILVVQMTSFHRCSHRFHNCPC